MGPLQTWLSAWHLACRWKLLVLLSTASLLHSSVPTHQQLGPMSHLVDCQSLIAAAGYRPPTSSCVCMFSPCNQCELIDEYVALLCQSPLPTARLRGRSCGGLLFPLRALSSGLWRADGGMVSFFSLVLNAFECWMSWRFEASPCPARPHCSSEQQGC
jgi:hypothetical protein